MFSLRLQFIRYFDKYVIKFIFVFIYFFNLQNSHNDPIGTTPNQKVVDVTIPDIGTYVVESEEGGYDDEVSSSTWSQTITSFMCCT